MKGMLMLPLSISTGLTWDVCISSIMNRLYEGLSGYYCPFSFLTSLFGLSFSDKFVNSFDFSSFT